MRILLLFFTLIPFVCSSQSVNVRYRTCIGCCGLHTAEGNTNRGGHKNRYFQNKFRIMRHKHRLSNKRPFILLKKPIHLIIFIIISVTQITCTQHTDTQQTSSHKNKHLGQDTVNKYHSDSTWVFCRTLNGDSLLALKAGERTLLLKIHEKSAIDTLYNQKYEYDSVENLSIIEDFNIFNEKAIVVYRNIYRSGFIVFTLQDNKWKKNFRSDISMYPQYGVVHQETNDNMEPFSAEIVSDSQIKVNDFGKKYTLKIDLKNRQFIKASENQSR